MKAIILIAYLVGIPITTIFLTTCEISELGFISDEEIYLCMFYGFCWPFLLPAILAINLSAKLAEGIRKVSKLIVEKFGGGGK